MPHNGSWAAQAHDIFLSFPGVLRPLAERIGHGLEKRGRQVFWDTETIQKGAPYVAQIEEAIYAVKMYVILVSPASLLRFWVRAELDMALRRRSVDTGLAILPVFIGDMCEREVGVTGNFEGLRLPAANPDDDALAHLCDQIHGAAPSVDFQFTLKDPFPGLAPFDEERAPFFFGRESEIKEALCELGRDSKDVNVKPIHWLHVTGVSGTGKSSFIRAGMVPALRRGEVLSRFWHVGVMRPGDDPIRSLAEAITRTLGDENITWSEAHAALRRGPLGLSELLRDHRADGHRFALVVDQLEEALIRHRADPGIAAFDGLLANALDDSDVFTLITSLRADFSADFVNSMPRLSKLVNRARQYVIAPMAAAALRTSFERTARLAHLRFADGLLDRLLADASRDENAVTAALPLLAHVLFELQARGQRAGDHIELTHEAYQDVGAVPGAVARAADRVITGLTSAQSDRVSTMLRALLCAPLEEETGARFTRRAKTRAELSRGADDWLFARITGAGNDSPQRLPRLVIPREDGLFELAHEALTVHWPWLRAELEKHRTADATRRRLEDAAAAWRASGMDESWLAQGKQLAMLDAVAAPSDAAVDFLIASREREKQSFLRRHKVWAATIWGLTMGVAGGLVYAISMNDKQERRFDSALEAAEARGYPGVESFIRSLLSQHGDDAEGAQTLSAPRVLGIGALGGFAEADAATVPPGYIVVPADRPGVWCGLANGMREAGTTNNDISVCVDALHVASVGDAGGDADYVMLPAIALRQLADGVCTDLAAACVKDPKAVDGKWQCDPTQCVPEVIKVALDQPSRFTAGCSQRWPEDDPAEPVPGLAVFGLAAIVARYLRKAWRSVASPPATTRRSPHNRITK